MCDMNQSNSDKTTIICCNSYIQENICNIYVSDLSSVSCDHDIHPGLSEISDVALSSSQSTMSISETVNSLSTCTNSINKEITSATTFVPSYPMSESSEGAVSVDPRQLTSADDTLDKDINDFLLVSQDLGSSRGTENSRLPLRRVSSLEPVVEHEKAACLQNIRRTSSFIGLSMSFEQDSVPTQNQDRIKCTSDQVQKVRFFSNVELKESLASNSSTTHELSELQDSDLNQAKQFSRFSSFRELLRTSSKRKGKKLRSGPERESIGLSEDRNPSESRQQRNTARDSNDRPTSLLCESSAENNDSDERNMPYKFGFKQCGHFFQRSQSTRSRLKRLTEDDDFDDKDVCHSATDGNFFLRGSSFIFRHLNTSNNWPSSRRYNFNYADVSCHGASYVSRSDHLSVTSSKDRHNQIKYGAVQDDHTSGQHHSMSWHIMEALNHFYGSLRHRSTLFGPNSTKKSFRKSITGYFLKQLEH